MVEVPVADETLELDGCVATDDDALVLAVVELGAVVGPMGVGIDMVVLCTTEDPWLVDVVGVTTGDPVNEAMDAVEVRVTVPAVFS